MHRIGSARIDQISFDNLFYDGNKNLYQRGKYYMQ